MDVAKFLWAVCQLGRYPETSGRLPEALSRIVGWEALIHLGEADGRRYTGIVTRQACGGLLSILCCEGPRHEAECFLEQTYGRHGQLVFAGQLGLGGHSWPDRTLYLVMPVPVNATVEEAEAMLRREVLYHKGKK